MFKENTLIHQADLSGITSKQVLDETTAQMDGFRCSFQLLFKTFLDSWLNEIQIRLRLKCIAVKGKHPHRHYKLLTWGDIAHFCLDSVSAHIKILAKNFQLACAVIEGYTQLLGPSPLEYPGMVVSAVSHLGRELLISSQLLGIEHHTVGCCSPSNSSQRMQKGAEGGGNSLWHMRDLRQRDLIVPLNILPLEPTDQFSQ